MFDMIKDLPTIHKMSQFNYNFENRTIDVIMEKSDNNSFTINEILSIEKIRMICKIEKD